MSNKKQFHEVTTPNIQVEMFVGSTIGDAAALVTRLLSASQLEHVSGIALTFNGARIPVEADDTVLSLTAKYYGNQKMNADGLTELFMYADLLYLDAEPGKQISFGVRVFCGTDYKMLCEALNSDKPLIINIPSTDISRKTKLHIARVFSFKVEGYLFRIEGDISLQVTQ